MSGAILLIVIIFVVGVTLFLYILHLTKVDQKHIEDSDEQISITHFSHDRHELDTLREETTSSRVDTLKNIQNHFMKLYSFVESLYKRVKSQFQSRTSDINSSKENRQQDKKIQHSVKEQEALTKDLLNQHKHSDGALDTSFLEKSTPNPKLSSLETNQDPSILRKEELTSNIEKVETFVSEIASDTEQIASVQESEHSLGKLESESYYYEYMEKRYIDKIVSNPRDVGAYKKLGDLYVEMGNYEDAKESFQMVLKIKPQDDISRQKLRELEKHH